ncbi:MarR family winged helix-turn-helix transcriptional regulator [Novosphingobium piscinae]|uniref:MarR family transcriptional regulator n=1 Tax=Novosphingobium piscinae TaxID=1507448 RepID=A0A7X1FY81_9SPHN|nr:MarR family transcriptional regulator [Novosphingobium piscinae]MBC2669175.1 MarR family transcriptional regulator [Novosphingobium piscinae]
MARPTDSPELEIVFLASDISRMFRKRFDNAARSFGVTGSQWRVLGMLNARPGESQAVLAAELEVEAITAGRMIDRLEKAGLVERRADPADRRTWRLHLTAAGGRLLEQLRGTVSDVTGGVLAGFGPIEQDQLRTLLARLRQNLDGER